MKYIRYRHQNEIQYGVLEGATITRLSGNFLESQPALLSETINLKEVEVLAPVDPGKMIAIGLNYAAHAKEQHKPIPEEPMMFMVSSTAVIADNDEVVLARPDNRIDYEAELAVVIGQEAKSVKSQEALDYVLGYTCANDISDRHLQKGDGQFTRAKSFDTYKPLGPVIATDLNPNQLDIKLTLNGEIQQNSNTSDLIHNVEEVIQHITEVMTLYPGDVILTGTPSGVGHLQSDDLIEIEIEGIGKLTNRVR